MSRAAAPPTDAGGAGDRPLRIAFLDSWPADPAHGSGSAVAIRGLARGLETLGHRVVRPQPPSLPLPLDLRRLLYNAALSHRLRRLPFDRALGFDLDGFLAGEAAGSGYAVALKGIAADEARFESGLPRLHLRALSRLERRNARRACTVVVTSEYSRRAACRAYGLPAERVRVVPEGIDPDFWRPADRRRRADGVADGGPGRGVDGHGGGTEAPCGRPTVVSVARQYRRKNTATLLRAFPRVLRALPDARLRVVGGGPELDRLRRLAGTLGLGSRACFVGAVPDRHAVRSEVRDADVFCLPSLQEGFGIAFLEAMACGVPVVAADAGAASEVVPDGEAGLLVDGRDPEALAGSLLRLLRDPELRERMGRSGRRHALGFSWPRVARRLLDAVGWTAGPAGTRRPGRAPGRRP